jgi:exopolysaccharide biosynthesis polyprenyl glycosylphosphotransferase
MQGAPLDGLHDMTSHQSLPFRRRAAREIALVTSFVGDCAFFLIGLLGAFWIRFLSGWFEPLFETSNYGFHDYVSHFIFGTIIFALISKRSGLYSRTDLLRLRSVMQGAMKASFVWMVIYMLFSLLFEFTPAVSRIYVALGFVCGFVSLCLWRTAFHTMLTQSAAAAFLRQRILIVGWNKEASQIASRVLTDSWQPYTLAGCLPSAHNEYREPPPAEIQRLGDYASITDVVLSEKIDIVLLADLDPKTREIIALADFCDREMIQFKVIPSYFQILLSGLQLESVSGVPVLGVAQLPLDSMFNRCFKRTIDIIGALVGLALFTPFMLLFSILVYLESPGQVIYRQTRLGRLGRLFTIYKIRSMKLDAEKETGARWCVQEDDRRLRIGAFLRKFNIDELPQFWNVLKGDMSLVGPRPERPELIKDFKDTIPHYNARHNIKPGLTGWAQIHGLRGDTDLAERIRYDLFYIENWTPSLDFYVMALTFLRYKNAY